MVFDRNKFQAAKKQNILEQAKQAEERKQSSSFEKTRPDYVNLKMGEKNIVRIFPPHPGTLSYIYQKVTNWLPFEQKDDKTGKVSIVKKPIFNPSVHSIVKRDVDIVAFYRELVKKVIKEENDSAEDVKKAINALYNYKTGIPTSYKWVCYAEVKNSEGTSFGRLELSNSVKEDLDKLAFAEENAESTMQVDPFTDPDTGFLIQIEYKNPQEVTPQEVYSTTFFTKDYIPVKSKLTDNQLENFAKMDSLESMFVNIFTQKDVDRILEGLEVFDKQNNYGVLGSTEFLDFVQEIYDLFPKPSEEKESEPKGNRSGSEGENKIASSKSKIEEKTDLPWEKEDEEKEEAKDFPSARLSKEELSKKLSELRSKLQTY